VSNQIPRKLKHFAMFADGRGYAGRTEELTPPKLTRKMEEFRAGGMDVPIELDMGMDKLEASFSLGELNEDLLKLWGLRNGSEVGLRFKGALEADDGSGKVTPIEVVLRGRWREIDMGSWKAGDSSVMKVSIAVTYYKYVSNGQDVIEIDALNMISKVDGQDRLEQHRAAIGI